MTTELVPVESSQGQISLSPAEFQAELEQARAKAQSLKALIAEHSWSVKIGDSEHIRIEAWITLAKGFNCTAQVVEGSVRVIPGYKQAFEARAEVLYFTGEKTVVIGSAEAECGTDGDGFWEEKQPRHSVRSMAQTRALSKAISSVFRWVVVLAGYSGTPFEDMPADGGSLKTSEPPSDKQLWKIKKLDPEAKIDGLSKREASKLIEKLIAEQDEKSKKQQTANYDEMAELMVEDAANDARREERND